MQDYAETLSQKKKKVIKLFKSIMLDLRYLRDTPLPAIPKLVYENVDVALGRLRPGILP